MQRRPEENLKGVLERFHMAFEQAATEVERFFNAAVALSAFRVD